MDEVDINKDLVLSKLDYAISVVRDLEKNPDYINLASKNWQNVINLLKEIERDVRDYL